MTKQCAVKDCTKTHEARGYCRLHYERFKKTGDPLAFVQRRPAKTRRRTTTPAYSTAIRYLTQDRGRAADLDCVDCGDPALQWSYNHKAAREFHGTILVRGKQVPVKWSADPADYDPRCVFCHREYDRNNDSSRAN